MNWIYTGPKISKINTSQTLCASKFVIQIIEKLYKSTNCSTNYKFVGTASTLKLFCCINIDFPFDVGFLPARSQSSTLPAGCQRFYICCIKINRFKEEN